MAIFWNIPKAYIKETGAEYGNWVRAQGPINRTHVGRVMRTYKKEFKPMSDIYADKYIAVVINDDGTTEHIVYTTNFECDVTLAGNHAEVDEIAPELMEKYETVQKYIKMEREIQEAKDRAKRMAEAAEAEKFTARKGKRMEVIRGRKVKKGTVGVVFWVRDGRVGLDVTGKKDNRGFAVDPVWVDAKYLKEVA